MQPLPETSKQRRRRMVVLGGMGGAGLSGAALMLYRAAPTFWQQYSAERQRPIHPAPHRPDWQGWGDEGIHAAWIGHSTVLLRINGFTILTDPVFGEYAGIHLGFTTVGVKRLVMPALTIADLPPIDLVLLSHAHMDHFDLPSLRRLRNPGTAVVTARRTSDLLRPRLYKSVHELGWGETVRVGPALIKGLEVNHWGARMRTDNYRGYNGYLIEVDRYQVLFGGDTAFTTVLRKARTGRPLDLAIMPIGAYDPWIRNHCSPEEALTMAEHANAERILPVHHLTFKLSREPLQEPLERLLSATRGQTDRVVLGEIGQQVSL